MSEEAFGYEPSVLPHDLRARHWLLNRNWIDRPRRLRSRREPPLGSKDMVGSETDLAHGQNKAIPSDVCLHFFLRRSVRRAYARHETLSS